MKPKPINAQGSVRKDEGLQSLMTARNPEEKPEIVIVCLVLDRTAHIIWIQQEKGDVLVSMKERQLHVNS